MTRFHWEGLNLYMEEEWSGSAWVPKRAYINQPSALGGALARFDLGTSNTLDASDSGWFYHYDEAGNVILITDKNGGLIKHFEQDAWGNDLNGTFATTQNIRQHQTGKYLDETTGLYFFGARWYDPAVGRFISVSPLMPNEEEYAFCGNDPVNRFDGDGLLDEVVDFVVAWNEQLRMFDPDVAPKGSPEKARALISGIEVGAECLILASSPGPDELTLVAQVLSPTYRFLRKVPGIGRLLKKGPDVVNLIKLAEKKYPKYAGQYHNHHIIPVFLGGSPFGPTIRIPAAYHQLITNEFRSYGFGYNRGKGMPKHEDLLRIIKEVYSKYPIESFL